MTYLSWHASGTLGTSRGLFSKDGKDDFQLDSELCLHSRSETKNWTDLHQNHHVIISTLWEIPYHWSLLSVKRVLSFSCFALWVLQGVLPGFSFFFDFLLLFSLLACFLVSDLHQGMCLQWFLSLFTSPTPCERCRDMEAIFVYVCLVMWWYFSLLVRLELRVYILWGGVSSPLCGGTGFSSFGSLPSCPWHGWSVAVLHTLTAIFPLVSWGCAPLFFSVIYHSFSSPDCPLGLFTFMCSGCGRVFTLALCSW